MAEKRILYVATVVKTHIMHFHVPYLKMMHEEGWHTAVAGRNDYADPNDLSIPYCDDYYDIPFERNPFKLGNVKAYQMLKKVIENGEYDIVHCHTPVGGILTRLACRNARKKGTKVVYTAHGFHFFKGAPLRYWLLFFPVEWLCSFMTDMLITINQEDYNFARKHMHATKIKYMPGVGVNLEKFGSHSGCREEKRRSLGVTDDDFMLLSVAELTPDKNHNLILEALAILKNPHIRLISAGDGVGMERLKQRVHELNLENTVSFLGYRRDVKELYEAADVYVFPSFGEGLSLSLMEAMASGLPSVASRTRGNTDLVTDGKEGILVGLSPAEIADAIMKLYENRSLCSQFGADAKMKVQQFGIEKALQLMSEFYSEVI